MCSVTATSYERRHCPPLAVLFRPMYTSWLDRLGLHRPELRAWALYDVANSAWMTTIMTTVFPPFFVGLATAAHLTSAAASSRFAFASAISVILVGLTGPLLGAIADLRGSKKAFLTAFIAVGVACSFGLYFSTPERWALALTVFVIGNIAVTASLAFYNSLLPAIASTDEVDRVSTAGFALGYLGGGLLLAANLAMISAPRRFGIADEASAVRLSFASVGVWWALFSIPVLLRVREPRPRVEPDEAPGEGLLRVATGRLVRTFRELRVHKDAGTMLLAFLVYNDAVNTFIRMGTIYGVEIGIPVPFMMATLVAIQLVGVPFSFALGMLADRIGAKRTILLTLCVYGGISVYAFWLQTSTQFLVMGLLIGTVQGGAQALARSLFASMIPQHKAGEMFGFFGVFDRFGGAIGALIFATTLSALGTSRPAILSLIVFFVLGGWLLTRVDVERGRRLAREAEAAAAAVPATAGAA
jgi:MFS transporter, UMF1 family